MKKQTSKILIGVSACLLGEPVRYDGQDKKCKEVFLFFQHPFQLIPFCPEVSMGLGVPRDPIHLVYENKNLELVDRKNSQIKHTEKWNRCFQVLKKEVKPLSGFILKSKSPSCGLYDTPVTWEQKTTFESGIFARSLHSAFPELPLIDEKSLLDTSIRKLFIQNVKNYASQKA